MQGEARFRREQHDFDALFRAHHAEIVRYLAARLGSREEAADVAAEVFVEAWPGGCRGCDGAGGRCWRGSTGVAANMAADRMTVRRREPVASDVHDAATGGDEAATVIEREATGSALCEPVARSRDRRAFEARRGLPLLRRRAGDGAQCRRLPDARAARGPGAADGARAEGIDAPR